MTNMLTDKKEAEIEERYRNANDGMPHDWLTFHRHANQDISYLIAALRQARQQAAESLLQAAPQLLAALQETVAEIEHWHADMLSEEERQHSRGSGWARVYDKAQAAIAATNAASRPATSSRRR